MRKLRPPKRLLRLRLKKKLLLLVHRLQLKEQGRKKSSRWLMRLSIMTSCMLKKWSTTKSCLLTKKFKRPRRMLLKRRRRSNKL